jgi:DNA (cytosine-5)-methyltransferase 1
MKILNLYAGIGGNRMLWGDEHEIVAVENDPAIAAIYQHLFPNDTVVVDDAHEYLRAHFREFDFIWSSPPCPTHSVLQMSRFYDPKLKFPDMTLYQEIIWLQTFFKGKWVIENVLPYYKPLIAPTFTMERHCYWASDFVLCPDHHDSTYTDIRDRTGDMEKEYGLDLSRFRGTCNIRTVLRNMVKPEDGKFVFDALTVGVKK